METFFNDYWVPFRWFLTPKGLVAIGNSFSILDSIFEYTTF
jgi:hypothetical protein